MIAKGTLERIAFVLALCGALTAAACSMRGTPFNTTIVRDNEKVYKYKGGVITCPDGRHIPYHPTDYEKESGFSIPSICNYGP